MNEIISSMLYTLHPYSKRGKNGLNKQEQLRISALLFNNGDKQHGDLNIFDGDLVRHRFYIEYNRLDKSFSYCSKPIANCVQVPGVIFNPPCSYSPSDEKDNNNIMAKKDIEFLSEKVEETFGIPIGYTKKVLTSINYIISEHSKTIETSSE